MTTARSFVVGLVAALAATLVFAVAFAQDATSQDDVLQRYDLAVDSLATAVEVLPDDAVEARSALDRAFTALLTLSRGDASALVDSLDRVFERARTAIDNRSATDLAVQAQVLTGGFQRLLFESALIAAVEGDDALARERLLALADDVGLGAARALQLESETEPGPLRRVFEAGVAEQVAARLQALVDGGAPDDRDAAYRQLARAYADFLLVQDSGRLDPVANQRFVTAATSLVDEDDEGFLAALTDLTGDLAALRDAADAGTPPRDDAVSGVVADLGGDGDTDQATADEGSDTTEGDTATSDDAADATVQDGELDLEALRTEIAAEVREEIEAELEAAAIADLAAELTALGVAAADRDALAAQLYAADVASVASLEAELAALATAFDAAVLRGDVDVARDLLDTIETTYGPVRSALGGTDLAALTYRLAPEADQSLRATLDRLRAAPTLRSSDASLLVAEVATLSEALRGGAGTPLQNAIATTADWWGNWVRPVAMIVLALLALIPLRLIRLAFGGGNANWGQVGFALFLLLLPLYVEGVLAAAALLADPLGVPSLAGWSVASIFASELTQFVWAAVTLVAVLFLISGFYGINVQFGVLGRSAGGRGGRGGRARTTSEPGRGKAGTLVDWDDDEF